MSSAVKVDGHVGPSALTALGERLPAVLTHFTEATGPVENCTSDLNAATFGLLDSVAAPSTKTRPWKRSTPWFIKETFFKYPQV